MIEWRIESKYDRWETVYHAEGREDALLRLEEYRSNEPGTLHRIKWALHSEPIVEVRDGNN